MTTISAQQMFTRQPDFWRTGPLVSSVYSTSGDMLRVRDALPLDYVIAKHEYDGRRGTAPSDTTQGTWTATGDAATQIITTTNRPYLTIGNPVSNTPGTWKKTTSLSFDPTTDGNLTSYGYTEFRVIDSTGVSADKRKGLYFKFDRRNAAQTQGVHFVHDTIDPEFIYTDDSAIFSPQPFGNADANYGATLANKWQQVGVAFQGDQILNRVFLHKNGYNVVDTDANYQAASGSADEFITEFGNAVGDNLSADVSYVIHSLGGRFLRPEFTLLTGNSSKATVRFYFMVLNEWSSNSKVRLRLSYDQFTSASHPLRYPSNVVEQTINPPYLNAQTQEVAFSLTGLAARTPLYMTLERVVGDADDTFPDTMYLLFATVRPV